MDGGRSPVPGKVNVLYMAWEADVLPVGYRERIGRADAVIVTVWVPSKTRSSKMLL